MTTTDGATYRVRCDKFGEFGTDDHDEAHKVAFNLDMDHNVSEDCFPHKVKTASGLVV